MSSGTETVFETNDPGLLAVAQSLLEAADIPFIVAGAVVTGQTPGGIIGPYGLPRIQVPAEDAADARDLLKDLV
jgi:hypothetical protein